MGTSAEEKSCTMSAFGCAGWRRDSVIVLTMVQSWSKEVAARGCKGLSVNEAEVYAASDLVDEGDEDQFLYFLKGGILSIILSQKVETLKTRGGGEYRLRNLVSTRWCDPRRSNSQTKSRGNGENTRVNA
jgi:hypothetical protein